VKARCAALPALLILALADTGTAADLPLGGIALGTSVSSLAQTLGPPATVTSDDSGNGFVFPGGATAYADDDGIVLAVDLHAGHPRVDIDGKAREFPIGAYWAARADAELAGVAEFATPTLRSYRLAPRRDLVLGFAAASGRLERVVYGEPGQLARLGLLPGDAAAKVVIYRAPQPRRPRVAPTPTPTPAGTRCTVYRMAVDRAGNVQRVDVIVPSDAPHADADLGRALAAERYLPATLDGRPIAAAVFVELHH
jgi:hypothetical protein